MQSSERSERESFRESEWKTIQCKYVLIILFPSIFPLPYFHENMHDFCTHRFFREAGCVNASMELDALGANICIVAYCLTKDL